MRAAFQGFDTTAHLPSSPQRHREISDDRETRTPIRTHPLTGGLIAKTIEHPTRPRKCTVLNPCQASEPTKRALLTPEYPQEPPEWPFLAISTALQGDECSSPTWINSDMITPRI